jgi:hypothetical protein
MGVLGKAAEATCGGLCGVYAVPHSHAQESAMRHVEDVAENRYCTRKQAQNNNAAAKQRLILKLSCAVLGTFTSR